MDESLYGRVLAQAWTQLASPVRRMHTADSPLRARGRFRIEYGSHGAARILARLCGLPLPEADASARLVVVRHGAGEHWLRTLNGRRFATRQYTSDGSELVERFGVLEFRFGLLVSGGGLVYVQRSAGFHAGPIRAPIPARWAPRVEAREDPVGPTRVRVHVRVVLPIVGPLITYGGVMEIDGTDQ